MLNTIFIFGAQYLFVFSIIIASAYFLKQPWSIKKKILVFGVISVIFIYGVALVAGMAYNDPRPFVIGNFTPLIPHAPDNGFPSDHVLLTSAIATIIYFFNSRIGLGLWALAVLVAISRVYVGVHHPIDVVASMLISLLVSSMVYLVIKNVKVKKTI